MRWFARRRTAPALGTPAVFDTMIDAPRMRRLHGDTGYFNVGWWEPGTEDIRTASEQLVDRVIEAVPVDAHRIADVGCGFGAGTRRLMASRPAASVTAVNISPWQLGRARAAGVGPAVAADAVRLPFRDASLDAVVAVESPLHFDLASDFFLEAARVLRPGGVISLSDLLVDDVPAVASWMVPEGNRGMDLDDYARLMRRAGLVDVATRDVTEHTAGPYFAALVRTYGDADDGEREVSAMRSACRHYLLAVASRP